MDKAARPRRGAPPGRPEAPGAPSGPIGSPGPTSAIGAAIRSLGTPDFPAAFARMAASDFLADQVVVFRAGGQGRIRTLLRFRRLSVRPRHPESDPAAQEAFRGASPSW